MKKPIVTFLLALTIAFLFSYPVKVTSLNIREDVKRLNSLHYSVDYVNQETQTIIVYVPNDNEYQKLLSNGFNAEIMPDLAKINADNQTDAKDDNTRAYYTLDEYHTFMQSMVTQYPNLCQLVQFGTSVQNRPQYFLKISDNVSIEENEPEFRYISSIHGDEVVGFDMCIRLIQLLTSQYATNTRISNIVNNTEIWICPMYNPDGYVAHERYNANDSDLNRNFPLPVGNQHPDGMATQPETTALMNFGNAHSINMSANFHGGSLVANYPWDYIYPLCPDNDVFIQAALSYANYNLPMHNSSQFSQGITNGAQWYIATGTLQDWVYSNNNCMDITIELGDTKWPPSSQLATYWSQNQESMLSYLEFVQKGVYGTVTNSQGTPLAATIHLNSTGIDVNTDPQVGDYHRILLPGTYTITASAVGYNTVSATVTVPVSGSVMHNFILTTSASTDFSGYVVNSSGLPLSGANVSLVYSQTQYQTQTDSQGYFILTNVSEGDYTLRASSSINGAVSTSFNLSSTSKRQIIVIPEPLFTDNFENGISNWTVQSPWGIASENSNHFLSDSPAGNYNTMISLYARMTNPVSLVNVTNPVLAFDTKYNLEFGFDFVNVQVSTDGINWTNLTQLSGVVSDWETLVFSLNDYVGSSVRIRFMINTDYSSNFDGIYVDNVIISGSQNNATAYGDIDANSLINAIDFENVLQYSVGNDPIPLIDASPWETFRLNAADVDNDNQITATDAYYIYDKYNQYNGAFPAQNGNAYTFQNPNLTIQVANNEIRVIVNNPDNLKSLLLTFSTSTNLSIESVDWQVSDEQTYKAINSDNKTIGMIRLQSGQLSSLLALLPYLTADNVIHCSGLVNDIPVSFDINTTANQDNQSIPLVTNLEGNYPNPFNPETTIRFTLAKNDSQTKLVIFNVKGQEVKTLLNGNVKSGVHSIKWNGTDNLNRPLGSGIYYYRLQTKDATKTLKMVMLK